MILGRTKRQWYMFLSGFCLGLSIGLGFALMENLTK